MDFISNVLNFHSDNLTPEIEALQKGMLQKKVKKGEIILHEGDAVNHLYYVQKGLLRSYTIDHKGKEHIFLFSSEGWMITDGEALDNNSPAVLFIDALEDSEIQVMEKQLFQAALISTQGLNQMNLLLRKRIYTLEKRVRMLMSATALERYEHFLETYPQITQRVPQRMIASYLGITPEALSKIRGEQARKK